MTNKEPNPAIAPKKSMPWLRKGLMAGIAASSLLLGACATNQPMGGDPVVHHDPINSQAVMAFNQCKQQGLAMDASAKQSAAPAQFLAAAKTLDGCLRDVDSYRHQIPQIERMQVHALTEVDFLKGGDAEQARVQLNAFTLAYPNSDLYFNDYTSFVDSMQVLLNEQLDPNVSPNVSAKLQSEVERQRYWQTH